jgi:catechol 2,3-dioxygenase-like lactoylglutathione lyase family enzyme
MLDHVSLRVADYDRSKRFYAAALAPLGYSLAMENASGAGFRKGFIPGLWIKQGEPMSVKPRVVPLEPSGCGGPAIHVAFAADNRATVDAVLLGGGVTASHLVGDFTAEAAPV